MIRVAVVGTSCSGKTTLARKIAGIKGIPHIELDAIHWGRDWTPKPIDKLRAEIHDLVAQDEWVIDGNYSKLRDIIWPRATHLVWLNLPFPRVFWRALSRTTKRVLTQEELWGGNRETLRLVLFDRDSILWWVIQTHRRNAREYRRLIESGEYDHLQVYELRSPGASESLLGDLRALD
jgi:adenylate kinase family enzyme